MFSQGKKGLLTIVNSAVMYVTAHTEAAFSWSTQSHMTNWNLFQNSKNFHPHTKFLITQIPTEVTGLKLEQLVLNAKSIIYILIYRRI